MIRVLHISPNGELYGTERHILSILKYADRSNFDNTVATPTFGSFNKILDEIGIKYEIAGRIPNKRFKMAGMIENKGLFKLIKLIRKNKYDVIHTHLNSYGGFASKLFTPSKTVHTRHGVFWSETELSNIGYLTKKFQKLKSDAFDITIAIGEYEKNTLIDIFDYDPKKVRLTYNGVTVDEVINKVDRNLTKNDLFGTEDIVVGAVGRLEKQKGFDNFLFAAKKVLEKNKNVKFVLIGDGSLKNQLIKLRNELGLNNNFEFIDYKTNIYDYINCFDIMVQTSLWEGISYVVQEAMALSKPVIALTSKNVSGVKEIIIHGKTGYLVDSDFEDRLGDYIIECIGDSEKMKSLGAAGFQRVKNDFSEVRTAKDMEKVYTELVNSK
jgi:glycosyltransferase involved in cell wall biosynthesis